jgi:hypothetical protein
MSVAVTLIHGTWGRKSAWTKESSKLSDALRKGISNQLFLRRFEWSGGNSPSARSRAAQELRQNLLRGITEYPNSKHFIIAHSHGGNVALYALRDSDLLASISGLVCLSTPFLNAQKRDLGPYVLDSFFFLAFLMIFGILSYLSVYWNIPGKLFAAMMVAFCLVAIVLIGIWESVSEKIITIFETPSVPSQKLLIVRMSADEASSALATSQFVGWSLGRLWSYISNLSGTMRTLMGRVVTFVLRPTWTSRVLRFGFAAAALVSSFATIINEDSAIPLFAKILGIITIVILFLFTGLILAVVFSSVLSAILLLMIVLPVSIATLPFGPALVLSGLFVEITAEPVPTGDSYQVHSFTSLSGTTLSHTQSYDDERSVALIVDWINQVNRGAL